MKRTLLICIVCVLFFVAAIALAQTKPRLAVMEIDSDSKKLSKTMVKRATRYMRSRIEVAGTYDVIDKDAQDRALTLQMQKESYNDNIYAEEFQIEVGRALFAKYILRSKVTEFGGVCRLTAAFVNLETCLASGGAEAEFKCSENGLKKAIDSVVGQLTGKSLRTADPADMRDSADKTSGTQGGLQLTGKVAHLWAKCRQKDYNACGELEDLDWVTYDAQAAVRVFRQACDQANMMGCGELGWMLKKGFGIGKDYAMAVKLYRRACDGGNMQACNGLGYAYTDEDGPLTVNFSHAARLYRQACDGGVMWACNNLGVVYFMGKGVGEDKQAAFQLFKRACEGGSMSGCFDLGWCYLGGHVVPKNITTACKLFKKACDGRDDSGCEYYQEHCQQP